MKFGNLRSKYIFVLISLLFTFFCGYNFKRWHATHNRVEKHISLMYSFSEYQIGYGNFEELVKKEFRKQGIEPVFDKFYLDCNRYNQADELENMGSYLETIKGKPIDLILTIGDQSAFALLSTRHQILSSIPVVACNVHFPDEKLVGEYESRKVYVLRDRPDFRRNMDFIKSLQPHASMEILYNTDFTALGHKSFDLLTHIVDRKNVRIMGYESAFPVEKQYKRLHEMIEYYNLMPAVANESIKKSDLIVSLCPFRYINGEALLVMMEKSKSEQGKKAFLLDKFDVVSLPIVKALNIPSFSCIREGFGEKSKIVGGYMATEEISARSVADFSARLLRKEKIGMPKIMDLEKEYVLDWRYFSLYDGYDVKHVPNYVRIINYPFYDRYREELYLLGGLFILAFILLSVSLLHTRKHSRIARKNLMMLEEVHKRLTLSTDGGQISLWNMQGDIIEFDHNFAHLMRLKQQRFEKADFAKYVHPDDVPILSSLYEILHQSSDMQIRRVRFSFSEELKDYQWYELRCRSLNDARGGIMLAGIMQNIQEVVEREHQLILAKQMAEKAELKQSFLNNMSHEIRTPLNAIVGFTNLLAGENADEIEPEEKATMLELINHNNDLLLKLINDVLEISRLDSGNMDFKIQEWDLRDVVREIYKTYQQLVKPALDFRLEMDDTISLPVNIDFMRFTQVISNFLGNANKFTHDGHITLGCKVNKENTEVCIYVEDTGKGIDQEELTMIFDRFYKTDEFEEGSGLGLSICKVIVGKLSGRIEVHSEIGKGSCFAVVLPLIARTVNKDSLPAT